MKISTLIFISIFFILLLFSYTTYVNYKQSEDVRENAAFFSLSSGYIRQTNQLQRNIFNMERSLRGYFITGEDYLLQTYDSAKQENEGIIKDLLSLSETYPFQKQGLLNIQNEYAGWMKEFADPIKNLRQHADSFPDQSKDFEKIYLNIQHSKNHEIFYKNLQTDFAELRNLEYSNREVNRKRLEESEQQTKFISFILTGLSIIFGFVIAFFLARYISERIRKMSEMADNIAGGNYNVHVPENTNDELNSLSKSLNNMADMLAENISMLQQKNIELDQFAHIVSHDLKAPLRGIDNVVNWIEEDFGNEIPSKVQEYLILIKGRITRLENMIEGILSYARIGKGVQKTEEVSVNELVHEILGDLIVKDGLAFEISENLPVLKTHKIPLMQVFTNLISNAIKYHDKKNGYIKIDSVDKEDHYEFSIEDNGPGIAAAYHEKIFMIFQTLKERDTFESTGVGLAIVKKILTDRKEEIKIKSVPGMGSTFSFTWAKNL